MNPYRGTSVLACPRCNEQLQRGAVVECPGDCGLWDEATVLDGVQIASLGQPLAKQVRPGPCPSCRKRMVQRIWEGIVFEVCGGHGLWIDRSYRKAFSARVGDQRDRERAQHEQIAAAAREAARETGQIAEIVAQLADEERRFDFARRFLALELRVAQLERLVQDRRDD